MSSHLMLVPSLACPASCAYCFGPHAGGQTMSRETLVPGAAWYRTALPLLRDGLAPRRVRSAAQSNLWLPTDELCELFREYGVSLDARGPASVRDRGARPARPGVRGAGGHETVEPVGHDFWPYAGLFLPTPADYDQQKRGRSRKDARWDSSVRRM